MVCTLGAGSQIDRSSVRLEPAPAATTVHLLVSADLNAPGAALFRCRHYSPRSTRVRVSNIEIAAINVGSLANQ